MVHQAIRRRLLACQYHTHSAQRSPAHTPPARCSLTYTLCRLIPYSRYSLLCAQDFIVGGAVTAAVGAALYSGLKKEPVPCDLCAGNGGIRCFACQGGGSMDLIDKDLLVTGDQQRPPKRDVIGRSGGNPRACKVCKGTGLVLCSKCRGSGYITKF
eukprot:GHUV01026587.1.p2 GENE.GHUV01026587.1~~GHUV01026587.1.p2  ORF type:complete len:156 (-),score=7.72 GHUV01026587.1:607-1074(-)